MAATEAEEEAKLENFTRWLQVNGVDLRGCSIQHCGPSKGFGVFSSSSPYSSSPNFSDGNGVLMVVPLDLAITPMRVLQDSLLGPRCGEMYREGDVDDRFLMMLFLTVERLRPNSTWKPYLDMLPNSFGSPLWFSDEELSKLKGTPLYRATLLQKRSLRAIFDDKAKSLIMEILNDSGVFQREVTFEDFLWANSIFWTRALNIPFLHSYVFPSPSTEEDECSLYLNNDSGDHATQISGDSFSHENVERAVAVTSTGKKVETKMSGLPSAETVWAEGLVPGIDFCNHDVNATVMWEVDDTGSKTGLASSIYLLSAEQNNSEAAKEIKINYGNKGNEELLYLYGFIIDNNPDDYLMMHYPLDAFKELPFADSKARLLEVQKAELRWLLPKRLLDGGFFPDKATQVEDIEKGPPNLDCSYSWSGQRKAPCYLNKLVFPEDFLASLRTIAMSEEELAQVKQLLEELVGSDDKKQPSNKEVQAAIWEICGDSGALQMLVDLLLAKIMELEEGSGTEASDSELLEKCHDMDNMEEHTSINDGQAGEEKMNRNKWSCIVYRRGQKQLARLFLKEAEHVLNLCLNEQL